MYRLLGNALTSLLSEQLADSSQHLWYPQQGIENVWSRTLLEMGEGFACVGRRVHVELDGRGFYIDLLFYHFILLALAVIDLKAYEFAPEFAGKCRA